MANCKKCGYEFEGGISNYCPNCGEAIITSSKPSTIKVKVKRPSDNKSFDKVQSCPQCNNTDLVEITKTGFETIFNMVMGLLLLNLIGALIGYLYSNRTRRYWKCNNCNHVFMHPDELVKVVSDYSKLRTVYFIFQIVFWVLAAVSLLIGLFFQKVFNYGMLVLVYGFLCLYIRKVLKDRIEKYKMERDNIVGSKVTIQKVSKQ